VSTRKEIAAVRIVAAGLVILAIGFSIYTISAFIHQGGQSKEDVAIAEDETANLEKSQSGLSGSLGNPTKTGDLIASRHPVPVALNQGVQIPDGFRGEVHPLLFGKTRLEVTADWSPVGKGRDGLHRSVHPMFYSWFTELRPAQAKQTYTERYFSAFLPKKVEDVGQLWALDSDGVLRFLKQFHPRPSIHLVAPGRRAGPDGAFGLLRAVSPSCLDIVLRIHAEFYLTPDDWPANIPPVGAWYTPAYFLGRMIVNQRSGTVEYFRLALVTDKSLNVHLTVDAPGRGLSGQAHDVVRVDRMELTGGNGSLVENSGASWTKALSLDKAERRLAKAFYRSLEIDFVPLEQALVLARSRGRPIFAIVSWGSFEDQSC
jgi:hypothetical protein